MGAEPHPTGGSLARMKLINRFTCNKLDNPWNSLFNISLYPYEVCKCSWYIQVSSSWRGEGSTPPDEICQYFEIKHALAIISRLKNCPALIFSYLMSFVGVFASYESPSGAATLLCSIQAIRCVQ